MIKLQRLKVRILNLFKHPTIQGTLWKLSARIVGLVLQSVYFLLIARTLGSEQYGLFVGVMALVKLPVSFSSWGTPHILVKQVSRNRHLFNQYWGNALWIIATLGSIILASLLLLNQFVLPTRFALVLVLFLGLAELIFARIHEASLKSLLATDFLTTDAQLGILLSVNGLIAAFCLSSFFPEPTAVTWSLLYLISRAVTALIGFWVVRRKLGPPRRDLSLMKPEITQGFYFAVDQSSQTIYNDIDKTMLASMSTLTATGIYGAAYRIIEVGMIPVMALLSTTYAQFFRKGASGIRGSLAFAKRIVPAAGGYGALASITLWFCAPLVPQILGEEYRGSVEALKWLSPIIFLKSMQYFAADTLTGAGLQVARSSLQASIAAFNILLNLWVIPLYSWKGAAWSSLMSDSLLMLSLWGLVFFFARRQPAPSN